MWGFGFCGFFVFKEVITVNKKHFLKIYKKWRYEKWLIRLKMF